MPHLVVRDSHYWRERGNGIGQSNFYLHRSCGIVVRFHAGFKSCLHHVPVACGNVIKRDY